MKYFKVKNTATGSVSIMSATVFNNLKNNPNLKVDSGEKVTKIIEDKNVQVPVMISPFEKVEEVDVNGRNAAEATAHNELVNSEKVERDKLKK
jgi:hypothetical protein